MKLPWPAVFAGGLVVALGAAGLVRGAMSQSPASGGGATSAQPIVITNAWVREPTPPTDAAAAYFTVYNTTDRPDRLTSVVSGAGASSMLHTDVGGQMVAAPNGVVIPPHESLVLSPGSGHIMIERLFGTLKPGQTVNLELFFANAGTIDVTAPVIARLAPAPTATATSGAAK